MKTKKKYRYFQKGIGEWLTSYLIVLVIPIIICACFYLYSFFSTWRESHAMHNSSLRVAAKQIDDIFARTILLEYSIMNNESLQKVAELKEVTTFKDREKMVTALRSCEIYSTWYADISNYAIFFPNISAVISPGTYVLINETSNLEQRFGWNNWDWSTELYKKHSRDFFATNNWGTLRYITSLPLHRENINMNLVFEIDSSRIKNILSYLDIIGNGGFMILDKGGQVLLSYNLEDINIDEELSIEENSEYHIEKIGGKTMLVSCMESEVVDIKYVSIISFDVFWANALGNLIVFLLALVLCILSGFGISWFMAALKYKTYSPLQRLMKKKQENHVYSAVKRQNAIAIAIDNIVTEYENMQEQLESAESTKREFLLSSVMEGKIRIENVEQVLQANGIRWCFGSFILVMFRQKQFDYVYDAQAENINEADVKALKQILLGFVKELDRRNIVYETINIGEKMVYLIGLENQIGVERDREKKVIIDILQKLKETEDARLTISISDVHEQPISLASAYMEVVKVMEYQLAMAVPIIMSYAEMVLSTTVGYLFSTEREAELINLLKCGESEAAIKLVKDTYSRCIIEFGGTDGVMQCLVWDMAACIVRFEKNLGLVEDNWLGVFEKSLLYEKLNVMEKQIKLICKNVAILQDKKENILVNNVKSYVLENYSNPDLSNTAIADHFNLNASYLSTYFKEKTGVTLLNYVRNVRLDKAKELLKNTDFSLEEVSRMVGYVNSKNLISLFKKYEGITPANYRKNHNGE